MEARSCPRCNGRMETGFIVDEGDYSAKRVARWYAGPPEESMWTGLKTWGRRFVEVQTFRCERCALLESYAPEK